MLSVYRIVLDLEGDNASILRIGNRLNIYKIFNEVTGSMPKKATKKPVIQRNSRTPEANESEIQRIIESATIDAYGSGLRKNWHNCFN